MVSKKGYRERKMESSLSLPNEFSNRNGLKVQRKRFFEKIQQALLESVIFWFLIARLNGACC